MEWSQPQIQGDLVMPRAGHAGTNIDENWYIVGGGDNKSGMYDKTIFTLILVCVATLFCLYLYICGGIYGLKFCVQVPQKLFCLTCLSLAGQC